ncbi:MAG: AlpA family phage regulatory protein [Methylococcaceae bacterium]|nr:AlpA family phage regulatory protein [Methylococcales bacterium]
MPNTTKQIPDIGFLRLAQVLGLIPLGRTSWLNGVREGIYPSPVKLGARSVAWRVEDIRALVERLGGAA